MNAAANTFGITGTWNTQMTVLLILAFLAVAGLMFLAQHFDTIKAFISESFRQMFRITKQTGGSHK